MSVQDATSHRGEVGPAAAAARTTIDDQSLYERSTLPVENEIGLRRPVVDNEIGGPPKSGGQTTPLIERFTRAYEEYLQSEALADHVVNRLLGEYDRAQRAAKGELERLHDGSQADNFDARVHELNILRHLAIRQEEATISLALVDSAALTPPMTRAQFIDYSAEFTDAERRQLASAIDEALDAQQRPVLFTYDRSLRALLDTQIEDRDGEIVYANSAGTTHFTESDHSFRLARQPKEESIDVALRTAQARWGEVDIRGDDRFVERTLRRAVALNIPVSTPELQERIEALRAELAVSRAAARNEQESRNLAAYGVLLPDWADRINASLVASDLAPANEATQDADPAPRSRAEQRADVLDTLTSLAITQSGFFAGKKHEAVPLEAKGAEREGTVLATILADDARLALVGVDPPATRFGIPANANKNFFSLVPIGAEERLNPGQAVVVLDHDVPELFVGTKNDLEQTRENEHALAI